jgi:serine protease Do
VGIATAIVSRSGGFQGVGFAIPIDLAKPIVAQLRTTGRVTRGWLGVSIQPLTPELARSFGVTEREGALVGSVVDGSPAARAGIRPGDVILQYDGKDVDDPRALSVLVAGTEVGRRVEVVVWRDGQRRRIQIPIGNLSESQRAEAPGDDGGTTVASLGVEVEPLTRERARELGVDPGEGVVVTEVRSGSSAETAGLAAGDVIREVNRLPVRSPSDLEQGLARTREGQALLRVEREGAARYLVVQTG